MRLQVNSEALFGQAVVPDPVVKSQSTETTQTKLLKLSLKDYKFLKKKKK